MSGTQSDNKQVVFTTAQSSKRGRMFEPISPEGIHATDINLPGFNEITFHDMEISSQKPARGLEGVDWYIDPQTLKKVYRT